MLDDVGQLFCVERTGSTHSEIDSYFAIFVSPIWVGGYLYFWHQVRSISD